MTMHDDLSVRGLHSDSTFHDLCPECGDYYEQSIPMPTTWHSAIEFAVCDYCGITWALEENTFRSHEQIDLSTQFGQLREYRRVPRFIRPLHGSRWRNVDFECPLFYSRAKLRELEDFVGVLDAHLTILNTSSTVAFVTITPPHSKTPERVQRYFNVLPYLVSYPRRIRTLNT